MKSKSQKQKYNENSFDNDDIVETIRSNYIPPQIECEYSYHEKSYIEYVVGDCQISSYEKKILLEDSWINDHVISFFSKTFKYNS